MKRKIKPTQKADPTKPKWVKFKQFGTFLDREHGLFIGDLRGEYVLSKRVSQGVYKEVMRSVNLKQCFAVARKVLS